MTVDTLQIIKKDGTVVDAIGIDESSTVIQLYVPAVLFSEREIALFGVEGTDYSYLTPLETYEVDGKIEYNTERNVYIGETECYHMTGEYDNFVVKTIAVEIPSTQNLSTKKVV
jgi:hypothetical protein